MTAASWGQLAVILSPLAFLAFKLLRGPYIRLKFRRAKKTWMAKVYASDHADALQTDKAWNRTYGRAQLIKAVESDLEDSAFQQRARKAEGLGFLDEDSAA